MKTINYKVSGEQLISRIPGLFAFIQYNEDGTSKIVKATEGKQGNYGEIVANVRYDKGAFEHVCSDGTQLKITNGEKTYRSIISAYYKAIKDKEWERDVNGIYKEPFLAFVERGIGLRYIGLSEEIDRVDTCGVSVKKTYHLAPDYIYLADIEHIYNKVNTIKEQLKFWENNTRFIHLDKRQYGEMKNLYEAYNGDKLLLVLDRLKVEREEIVNEYFNYATNTNLTIDLSVNLTNTIKDLGIVTPYISEWESGKRYYEGDVVYYSERHGFGMTWICTLENSNKIDEFGRKYTEGFYDEDSEITYFDNGEIISIGKVTINTPKNWEVQTLNWVKRNIHHTCSKCGVVYYGDKPKKCNCGNGDFITKRYVETQNNMQKIKGTVNSKLGSLRRYATYMDILDTPSKPDQFKDWLWFYRVGLISNRETKYDYNGNMAVLSNGGKSLESIVGGDTPTNVIFDTDGKTVLNLAAYGDVITSITAENTSDMQGEITFEYYIGAHLKAKIDDSDKYYVKIPFTISENGQKRYYAYGEILDNKEYNSLPNYKDRCTHITWFSKDDDGNYKYFFKGFEIDRTSENGITHGVKYREKYIYYKGDVRYVVVENFNITLGGVDTIYHRGYTLTADTYSRLSSEHKSKCKPVEENIWTLVESGKFNDYVMGKYDKSYVPDNVVNVDRYYLIYDKMEFDTSNLTASYDIMIGNKKKTVHYIKSEYEMDVDITNIDVEETPLIRYDYYNGVTYQPYTNDDVNIERGLTQAFEKHIKFGEIKTFEDLENYANGGYFIISKESIDLG